MDVFKMIRMLYEVESYHKWLPFIKKAITIKHLSKSKKISYLQVDFPIIEERDIVIYSFLNNRLKESKTLQFLSKSADEENSLKFRNPIKKDLNFIRADLINSSFEIYIIENKKIKLAGYFNFDPKLKYLNSSLMEMMVKQYLQALFNNIDDLLKLKDKDFNKKIKKNTIRSESIDFYNFIYKEFKKYVPDLDAVYDKNEKHIQAINELV